MEEENKENQWEQPITVSHSGEVMESLVKEKCQDQREALSGEPRCVICGRYGEYICDETDDDICSTECKQVLLAKKLLCNSLKPENFSTPLKLPVDDECFYVRDKNEKPEESQFLTSNQIKSLRNKIDIRVQGDSVPAPILAFSDCNLHQKLQQNLEVSQYEIPTPVQMQVIPAALMGRNLLVSANTGSGKTASFLVPIISRCSEIRIKHNLSEQAKKPLAMVLAPTRELCAQVEEQAKMLGKGLPFKTALVVGGDAMAGQVYRIRQGVELIVGTPGRLVDLLTKHEEIELDEVSILVLDEVDCMLQRGFRDQVMEIFQALFEPQILMFSATIPHQAEKIASLMGKKMISISVGNPNRPNRSVKQVVIWVETRQKKQKLFEILKSKQHFKPPSLVFVGSRMGAELLCDAITVSTGLRAVSIHGEKKMEERRESLRLLLMGEVSVIVATGILGRGVDLLAVRQVIVFDFPNSIQEYVHQIGRASRLGEEGTAMVFVNDENKKLFRDLADILRSSGAAVPRELANSRYLMSSQNSQKKRKHGY